MAHVLRLKLQALYCPRQLSSPTLASKLLDTRHIPRRCYGESALLKESCNSTLNANDIEGDSKAANGGEDSARKGDRVEDRVSTGSDLDKLTISVYEKLRANKANIARDEKDNGFQRKVDPFLESKKDEKWTQVVSTVRTMALKSKAKALAGDKSLLPTTEAKEDQHDFSDLDLPEAGGKSGVSRDPNATNKSSLLMNAFGKSFKEKRSQSQFAHQQKAKDTKLLSFLKPLDNNRTSGFFESLDDDTSSNQTEISENKTASLFTDNEFEDFLLKPSNLLERNKDVMPEVDSKMTKGKDSALPQAAQDGSKPQVWNQSRSKGMPAFKAKGSGDAPPAQLHGKIPSNVSDNSVPCAGYMVCVQNLPANSNPSMVKASMAIHGEVSGLFKKTRNEYFNAYIQFKTEQGMESAIAARKLQLGGKYFHIARTDPVFSTVVRLSKVSGDTTEKQLLSICGKYGSIDNIRRRSSGVYDVFYQVKELPNMTSILGSLNEVTLNRSTWNAAIAPALHPSVQKEALKSPEGQAWHELQVHQALNRIELGIDSMSVLFEDLKELTALGKEFSKR